MEIGNEQVDRIVLVDDDMEIRDLLSSALRAEGFDVTACADTTDMRKALSNAPADLIIMDLMMPGEDGITATRALRAESAVPIIMLTAKGDEVDRIIGLEIGADDYMAKPFNTRELVARIRAVLRRHRFESSGVGIDRAIYRFEGWALDVGKRELKNTMGELVDLTSGEFELLKVFVLSPGRVLSRDYLLEQTKGRQLHAFDRSVDIQVSRLRNKVEEDAKNPKMIKTIRSGGYMLTAQVESE